jgi:hypothetical protein
MPEEQVMPSFGKAREFTASSFLCEYKDGMWECVIGRNEVVKARSVSLDTGTGHIGQINFTRGGMVIPAYYQGSEEIFCRLDERQHLKCKIKG